MTMEEGKGEKTKKCVANEAGNKQGPGHPWEQLSLAEEGMRLNKKAKRDADYQPKIKFEYEILRAFAMLPENIHNYEAFNEDYRRRNGASSEEFHFFNDMPDDLVISILSKISSSAGCPADFFNVLMTCQTLKRLAVDPFVLSKASSKMFDIKADKWSESACRFMTLCADAGNAEARSACFFLPAGSVSVTSDEDLFV